MSEYIVKETGYPGAVKQEIMQELVRCGECWKRDKEDYCPLVSDACYPPNLPDNWFCADGERREDDS